VREKYCSLTKKVRLKVKQAQANRTYLYMYHKSYGTQSRKPISNDWVFQTLDEKCITPTRRRSNAFERTHDDIDFICSLITTPGNFWEYKCLLNQEFFLFFAGNSTLRFFFQKQPSFPFYQGARALYDSNFLIFGLIAYLGFTIFVRFICLEGTKAM